MNKKYVVRLTKEEREELKQLVSKGKAPARKIKRANILLKADADGEAWSDSQITGAFCVERHTVENVRREFVMEGLEAALTRKKRNDPDWERKLDGEKEARLIALSCSEPPAGYGRWTLRLLADKMVQLNIVESISHETVRTALKKTN